tara:strand:- start:10 stop:396 length:387 start_codon:yes stop_codon:yes gene_type:complete
MLIQEQKEELVKMTWKNILKEEITYDNDWSNRMYKKFLNQLQKVNGGYLKRESNGKFRIEKREMDAEGIANELKNFAKPKYQGYVNGYSEQERNNEISAEKLAYNSTIYGHFLKFLRKTGTNVDVRNY